ncbi:hypothetical protein ACGTNG_12785 [Halomonas sp. 1390]|uniref:hypothetical protein n=1 Tax=Halomonas sp. B23F22_3 TaxID=3459516 RepID=UPI00373E4BCD
MIFEAVFWFALFLLFARVVGAACSDMLSGTERFSLNARAFVGVLRFFIAVGYFVFFGIFAYWFLF